MTRQSGAPFSVLSSRGTINRVSRSYYNTAVTALSGSQLADVRQGATFGRARHPPDGRPRVDAINRA